MFWGSSPAPQEERSGSDNNEPLSNQANAISDAMKEADKAIAAAFEGNNDGAPNEAVQSTSEDADEESTYADETFQTGAATNANTLTTLNLKENNTQFLVIAEVIVGKYEHHLKNGARQYSVSISDKEQLERMVNRDNFIDAVRYRLRKCPENSRESTHVLLRKCRALGLDRSGARNPLFARAGTLIDIEQMEEKDDVSRNIDQETIATGGDTAFTDGTETGDRKQLMAELREASNLMADSVTPEAAKFWRKHVVELQTRLRNLEKTGRASVSGDTERLICNEKDFLPVLCHNTGYVPPSNDELSQMPEAKARSQIKKPEPITNTIDPELGNVPMVDVVAPGNLPEGYTFEAEINGARFMATVPAGGVQKGQAFTCYMRDDMGDDGAPTKRWRDGLFDCFRYGVCHPMALNSICCPILGLSQVLSRVGHDFMGLPGKVVPDDGPYSTRGIMLMILGFWSMLNLIIAGAFIIKKSTGTVISKADIFTLVFVNLAMYLYLVWTTAKTRAFLRARYRINGFCCPEEIEDYTCAAACMPCVVSQMGRHTVSYIEHRGVCCSDTGLEPGVKADINARSHNGSYRLW